ncbi:MAG: tyrosine-type recombinase/integrase [Ilumatobacteraceae bacterium]
MSSIDTITADGKRLSAGSKAPKGAKYRARWRTPNGASRTKTFVRKIDAARHLASVTLTTADGSYVDPAAGRATFGAFAISWAAAQPHRPTTADHVERALRLYILPTFEARPIASVRTSEIQAWVTSLELAPSTVRVTYGTLAAIFRAAEEDRAIPRSPCTRRVKLPRPHGAEVVPMTAEQVRAIADGVDDRYRAFVVLLAGSGLRPAEGLGLTVDRVDFLRRALRVDRQLITVTGRPPMLAPPKTTSSVRTIPVPGLIVDQLAQHLERYPADADGMIFTNSRGRLIRRADLSYLWRAGARRAGVEGFTPHDLRHYAASVLIEQGASVKAVQRHLGHASATTTLDVYSHLWPDSEEVTRRALDAGLVGVVSPTCHDVHDVAHA